MSKTSSGTRRLGRLGDATTREQHDEAPPLREMRKRVLIIGIASILAPFLFPLFLLKLFVLVAGAACIGSVLMPRFFGRDRARAFTMGLFASTIAFGGSLALAEGAVRLAFADLTTTADGTSYFALRWKKEISTNTLGFRAREISAGRPEGVYRIAVIGDSFTWGQGIPRPDRMTERLEALLKEGPLNVEVLNFGQPGSETVDHVETLRDVVLPLQPDFVLLQWFVNDVEGHDKRGRPRAIRLLPSDAITLWLHRHSALYYLVNQQWKTLQGALGIVGSYHEYMDARFADPSSPDAVASEAALEEFISIAQDAGIGVGVVAFPPMQFAESPAGFSLGYLIDRVMEVCAAHGIGCVDLREAFAGVTHTEGWTVNRFDPHPGPRANAVAADAVAAIFRSRWVPVANAR